MIVKKTSPPITDPQIVAVIHRVGRMWCGLMASLKGSPPAIIATRDFDMGQINRFDEWLEEFKASSVLCVLPSSVVICRNNSLPDASPEQLNLALQLQAEAHLLGIAPPHRLAMAVLPAAPGETTRTGLVLAWPENAVFSAPPTNRPVTYVPDVAALAALMNGQRPNEAVMWLNREDGSVALAVTHSGGAIFRAVREDSQSPEAWSRNIARIAAETALSVGHSGSYVEMMVNDAKTKAASLAVDEARLFLPTNLMQAAIGRGKGFGTDQRWWSRYGVCAGALLARSGALSALTQLQHTPPTAAPSVVRTMAEKLSRPRTAAAVIVACVLVLMFGPLVFSGMRLAVLKLRFSDIDSQRVAARMSVRQLAVYQELQKQKIWPMTKLLADITANTPLGIELETIRIEADKEFALNGTAIATEGRTPAQLVALFNDNLASSGLFSDIAVTSGKTDNLGRYKFDLSAKVSKPFQPQKLREELDYAKKPWSVRLYGEPTGEGATAVAQSPPITSPPAPRLPQEEPPDAGMIDESEVTRTVRSGTGGVGSNRADIFDDMPRPNPTAPPPPLSEDQMKVMSKAELRDALAKVTLARQNKDLDKEIKDRLQEEFRLIMEHLRKAPS